MALTIEQINSSSAEEALAVLDGTYEHSPWIIERALLARPFKTLANLKTELARIVTTATVDDQLRLIRAHPELAGKAMVSNTLTADSTNEQSKAGLTQCTPEEFEKIQKLNDAYNERFEFPFVLAVLGARGTGLSKQQIIDTFERRVSHPRDFERGEALRNINRIAEMRLNAKFDVSPVVGNDIWDWAEELATHTDPGYEKTGQLTVTYLTEAHRACARQISLWMHECRFDEVSIDAVGNVVGKYHAATSHAKTLMTGSHYDTVRNGGKYDGRLGIFVPMACVRQLARDNKRLPFAIEVIGFAEEEGQRYKATFLGSGALTGSFQNEWLDQKDSAGISMRDAMSHAGLKIEDIPLLKRKAEDYLGFVEVHIEQGPVLNELEIPLGIVTSINGSVRYVGEVIGMASHAGTTPMGRRRDAALAVAELALFAEKRASNDADSVATMGMLEVPNGSINVVPGKCKFSLDIRAPKNEQRDAVAFDVLAELQAICDRRGLRYTLEETMRAAAAPSDPKLQQRWERAVSDIGLPVFRMPSGAGHDAMKLHEIMPQAMLFVRGMNSGISHNPLESSTNNDIELSVIAMMNFLESTAADVQAQATQTQ